MRRHASVIQPGLTLIELLVVVSILSLLIGLLMAGLGMARESARRVGCANSLHQIGSATTSYTLDNRHHLPAYWGSNDVTFDTFAMRRPNSQAVNLGLLLAYQPDAAAYYCGGDAVGPSPDLSFNASANVWNNGDGQPGKWLSSSYSTRVASESEKKGRTIYSEVNRVIYSEFIGVDGWGPKDRFTSKVYSPHAGAGYNLLFGDSTVHWVQSTAVNSLRPVGKSEPDRDEMVKYYKLLDILPAGGGGQPFDEGHDDDNDGHVSADAGTDGHAMDEHEDDHHRLADDH